MNLSFSLPRFAVHNHHRALLYWSFEIDVKVDDGSYPLTPDIGNTGTCLCLGRIPESDKLGIATRLYWLRQRLIWHRHLFYVCIDRVTNFFFGYSVLA
jgi:hypothetical protein